MRSLLTLLLFFTLHIAFAQEPAAQPSAPAAPKPQATAPAAPGAKAPAKKGPARKGPAKQNVQGPRKVSPIYKGVRQREKARGYRVQVYSGAGSTASKEIAQQKAAEVRAKFPEISVYCRFKSPRWVCRIGDFSTKAAAQRYLEKVRKARISPEASIVIDDVLLPK